MLTINLYKNNKRYATFSAQYIHTALAKAVEASRDGSCVDVAFLDANFDTLIASAYKGRLYRDTYEIELSPVEENDIVFGTFEQAASRAYDMLDAARDDFTKNPAPEFHPCELYVTVINRRNPDDRRAFN